MPLSFLPRLMTDELTDLTPELLERHNIRLLMMDFDNTIVPYTTNVPTPDMEIWLRCMVRVGVRLCVVSNSKRDRVKIFCKKYGIPCITHAKKPFSKGIKECLAQFGMKPEQCALVGDQIYTDMLGARRFGCKGILVESTDTYLWYFWPRRLLELPFRKERP